MSENSASAVESSLSQDAQFLLEKVRDQYLGSANFNGTHVKNENVEIKVPAEELLRAGLVQIVSLADFPYPHIRPWESKRTVEDQLLDIQKLENNIPGFYLYPTPFAMTDVILPEQFSNRPFSIAMARGKGALEMAYFEFDVLEGYRNDSRFNLDYGDNSASISINEDEKDYVPERDRIKLSQIGYAYNLEEFNSENPDSILIRRVVAFNRDLVKLTPELQRRWETYQVDSEGLVPHPLWWNRRMGEPEMELGPFDRLFAELSNINELCLMASEEKMLRSTLRPKALGWIVRPSQKEWEDFIHLMDKILSDNLNNKFFTTVGIPKKNDDGQHLGTLKRLSLFLQYGGINEDFVAEILEPLFRIRDLRHSPAHKVTQNLTDYTFVWKQAALVRDVNISVTVIRNLMSMHPAFANWTDRWSDYGDSII